MQYRVLIKGQRFGTEPISKPGVQRNELKRALKALQISPAASGANGEDAEGSVQSIQQQLVRANTQHFHELRARQAMQELLATVSRGKWTRLRATRHDVIDSLSF